MAKIFYSVAGEGLGHSIRFKCLAEELKRDHELTVYAPGQAYTFLKNQFKEGDVEVKYIPGLNFHYNNKNKLVYHKTFFEGMKYISSFPSLKERLCMDMEKRSPDLVITDFEPSLPRAARSMEIPFLSINHQFFLHAYDLSALPFELQFHGAYLGGAAGLFYSGQEQTVVSAFFFPGLKKGFKHVKQIGVLLRKEIISHSREDRGHVVAYLRKFPYKSVLQSLESCGRKVHIYGLGKKESYKNLRFLEIHGQGFIDDLATASALITTAGNQVVGESLYLEKPVLAIPEPGNFEQSINAHFLAAEGTGEYHTVEDINSEKVKSFLKKIDYYRGQIDKEKYNGNPEALKVISQQLEKTNTLAAVV